MPPPDWLRPPALRQLLDHLPEDEANLMREMMDEFDAVLVEPGAEAAGGSVLPVEDGASRSPLPSPGSKSTAEEQGEQMGLL